jgi:enoyl-CoA hydratase/carnithine racemase
MALAHDRTRRDFTPWTTPHFLWSLTGRVGTITLNRPERTNPLTFDSYAALRDLFRELAYAGGVKTIVITGAGRAAELFYTGRAMDGAEAERWGFFNRICRPETLLARAYHAFAAKQRPSSKATDTNGRWYDMALSRRWNGSGKSDEAK